MGLFLIIFFMHAFCDRLFITGWHLPSKHQWTWLWHNCTHIEFPLFNTMTNLMLYSMLLLLIWTFDEDIWKNSRFWQTGSGKRFFCFSICVSRLFHISLAQSICMLSFCLEDLWNVQNRVWSKTVQESSLPRIRTLISIKIRVSRYPSLEVSFDAPIGLMAAWLQVRIQISISPRFRISFIADFSFSVTISKEISHCCKSIINCEQIQKYIEI